MEETAACLKSFFGGSYGLGFNASGGYSFVHLAPISGLEDKLQLEHLDPQWWHQKRSTKSANIPGSDHTEKWKIVSNPIPFKKDPICFDWRFLFQQVLINKRAFGAQDSDVFTVWKWQILFQSNPIQSESLQLAFVVRERHAWHAFWTASLPQGRQGGWCKVGVRHPKVKPYLRIKEC